MDVFGFNYYCLRTFDSYDYIHNKYPDRMIIGTENGSAISVRGEYLLRENALDMLKDSNLKTMIWANEKRKYNLTAYGESYTIWGATPLETFRTAEPDYVAGYFLWTGFDYRGEIIPYDYPSTISQFGLLDLCGFTKDLGHHCRVKWSKEPAIHLYPHWTFNEDVGELEVDMVANTEEVELIVNGVSKGIVANPKWEIVQNFVQYEPGEIIAIGYNNGVEVIRTSHRTAGEPVAVKAEVVQDREYVANGEDNIFVHICVVDANDTPCPNADNLIEYEVSGAGEFLGCGNGNPFDHNNEMLPHRKLFNGLGLCILKTAREVGTITLTVRSR